MLSCGGAGLAGARHVGDFSSAGGAPGENASQDVGHLPGGSCLVDGTRLLVGHDDDISIHIGNHGDAGGDAVDAVIGQRGIGGGHFQ